MDRQIRWLDSLDPEQIKRNYTVERAPTTGAKITRMVYSNLLVICPTHWRGRTQPCTWPNCEDCDRGMVPEIHGYVLAINPKTEEKTLLELTGPPTAVLKEWQDSHGTVFGLGIEVGRKNDKPNGPVWLRIFKTELNLSKFGPPPDLKPILETLWRFSPDQQARHDATRARREMSVGEAPTPSAGPLGSNGEEVSKLKGSRRKRS